MNVLTQFFTQPWAERLGWTLLHFLWQGAAIAALFAAARWFAGGKAHARHTLACLALSAMAIAPAITWLALAASVIPAAGAPGQTAATPAAILRGAAASPSVASLLPTLVMAWLIGVIAFSGRLIGGWLSAARLRSDGARHAPDHWVRALERLQRRMHITAGVRLVVSERVDVPAVLGWLHPVVMVPLGALSGLPAEHIEALLIHELAHIRRNDYLVNLLQGVAEAVLFYHPAVWWVSRQIRVERELCCDDLAVEATGDVLTYARALAELEACRPSRASLAMAADGHSLAARIRRLVEPAQPAHTMPRPGAAWALALLMLAAMAAVAIGAAQERRIPASPVISAPSGGYPTISRDGIWVDTVRQGDMQRAVRGLGTVTSSTSVELKIAETQSKDLKAGQIVRMELRQRTDQYLGTLTQIRPGTLNGTVTVDVNVPKGLPQTVPTGEQVDGIIAIETIHNVVYVGRPVFGSPNSDDTIFRLEPGGGEAVRVPVHFGRSSVNVIEIASGLQPGDKVIVSDSSAFKNAERVYLK